MDRMAVINWLDVLIILTLISGMVIGYIQGTLRQLIWLVALYVAVIIAGQYHPLLAYYIAQVSHDTVLVVTEVIAFFIVLFVSAVVLSLIAGDILRHLSQKRVGILSRLGGGLLGLLAAAIFVSVSLIALRFMTATVWSGTAETFRNGLIQAYQASNVVLLFRVFFLFVLQTLRPWMPNLPPIFNLDLVLQ